MTHLRWIAQVIESCSSKNPTVASFGYPDLIIRRDDLKELLSEQQLENVGCLQDRHGLVEKHEHVLEVIDTRDVVKALGGTLEVFDISSHYGFETALDLNSPVPDELVNTYDLVIDPGTLEHCFNIAQAIINMARVTKVGGYVVHHNPLSYINHGFYNISPTLYFDFYNANGFSIECYPIVDSGKVNAHTTGTFDVDSRVNNNVLLKKLEHVDIRYPTQDMYRERRYLRAFESFIEANSPHERVAIVPAGKVAKEIMSGAISAKAVRANLIAFFDSHSQGELSGFTVRDLPKILEFNPSKILVTSASFEREIVDSILALGIPQEKVYVMGGRHYVPATVGESVGP